MAQDQGIDVVKLDTVGSESVRCVTGISFQCNDKPLSNNSQGTDDNGAKKADQTESNDVDFQSPMVYPLSRRRRVSKDPSEHGQSSPRCTEISVQTFQGTSVSKTSHFGEQCRVNVISDNEHGLVAPGDVGISFVDMRYPSNSLTSPMESNRPNENMSRGTKIFVSRLGSSIDERLLMKYFKKFGAVFSVEIFRDAKTMRSTGSGFVTMKNDVMPSHFTQIKQHIIGGSKCQVVEVAADGGKGWKSTGRAAGVPQSVPEKEKATLHRLSMLQTVSIHQCKRFKDISIKSTEGKSAYSTTRNKGQNGTKSVVQPVPLYEVPVIKKSVRSGLLTTCDKKPKDLSLDVLNNRCSRLRGVATELKGKSNGSGLLSDNVAATLCKPMWHYC